MGGMTDFSRREMLLAGLGSGLALAGRGPAVAQSAKRIEQMAPELGAIIDTNQQIRELATGFGGDIGPAEGPLWWAEGKYLLFDDIQTARRMKYTPGQGVTVAMEKTNEANGLTRDLQGRILSAEHLTRRVTRTESDGSITVVANSFQGKRLLRPNDVVVKYEKTDHMFVDLNGPEPGVPDGMKVDSAGNVYTGGAGGLFIMDKTGKKLGRIIHGLPATTNVAFGGDDWKTLYFTTRSSLNMVSLKIPGQPVPAKKKSA